VGNTSGPIYTEDGIGGIPTLRFNNSGGSFRYVVVDPNFKNIPNGGMTMFVVMRYRTGNGYFIDRTCVNSSNVVISCGSAPNTGRPLFGFDNANGSELLFDIRDNAGVSLTGTFHYDTGFAIQANTPYVFTFERNYGVAATAYVNGSSTYSGNSSQADVLGIITLDVPKIGRHSDNATDTQDIDISEVIFYVGRVKSADRDAIEEYLGKKYGIKVGN
jgi:hypothetical protein